MSEALTRPTTFADASPHRGRELWLRWTLAVALGELVGFAVPALAGALLSPLGLVDTAAGRLLLILAGVGEGAVLGLAQWLALRRYFTALPARGWVLMTALAAGVAWMIGLALSSMSDAPEITPLFMVGVVLLGLMFLLLMGGAQWLVLRHYVKRAWRWILANAIAWPLGVAVPVVAISLVPNESPVAAFAVVGIFSGVLMGVVVGAITGFALLRLLDARRLVG